MTLIRRSLIVALVAVLLARPASADWLVMPLLGLTFGADTNVIDLEDASGLSKTTYGVGVSWMGRGILGIEADFNYVPGFFQRDRTDLVQSSRVHTLMGGVIVAAPLSWSGYGLRPYAAGGFGLIHPKLEDVLGLLPVDENLAGFSVGGGAIGFVSDRSGVRFDLRYYRSVSGLGDDPISIGSPRLSFWRGSVALVVKLD